MSLGHSVRLDIDLKSKDTMLIFLDVYQNFSSVSKLLLDTVVFVWNMDGIWTKALKKNVRELK